MPNWCENVLRLEQSDKSKLDEALQAFNKEKLLDYFVPEPDHDDQPSAPISGIRLSDWLHREAHNGAARSRLEDDNCIMPRWYVWRMKNWGTKWDISQMRYKWISDHCLELSFDTPWCPPNYAYDAAVAIHGFKLVAFHNESNMGFCGEYVPNEKHLYFNYDDGIPTNLDEMFGIKELLNDVCLSTNRAKTNAVRCGVPSEFAILDIKEGRH